MALPIGTRLAEFELIGRLGEGGFSIVYIAWDHSLERRVALKEYMPGSIAGRVGGTVVTARSASHRDTFDAGLRSFVNESKLLAMFDHPSLVKVYRFWEANGTAYMVMPLYEGVTLKATVTAMNTPPDEAWLAALLDPLTRAMEVIHDQHCFHRDIAPDNILLLAPTRQPLLLDFGAARRVIGDMTHALTVILKPGYAPIEQYADVPGMTQGPWTDVYALGAVIHWAITGKKPPPAIGRMLRDSYVPLASSANDRYSRRFLQAVDHALALLPEARTQSIAALREELGLDGDVVRSQSSAVASSSDSVGETTTLVLAPSKRLAPAPAREPESAPEAAPPRAPAPVSAVALGPEPSSASTRSASDPSSDAPQPSDASGTARERAQSRVPDLQSESNFRLREAQDRAPRPMEEDGEATLIRPVAPSRFQPAPASIPVRAEGAGRVGRNAALFAAATVIVAAAAWAWLPWRSPTPSASAARVAIPVTAAASGLASSAPPALPGSTATMATDLPQATPAPVRQSPASFPTHMVAPAPTRALAGSPRPPSTTTIRAAAARNASSSSPVSSECAALFQRLSLGESDPELIARTQALRCR